MQIPLRNEAIQINLVVPLGKEGTADSLLAQFLSGLDGQSNWDDMRQLSPTAISSFFAICLFWIAIFHMKRSPNAVPRHRRAAKIGLGITAAVFVLLLLAGVIVIRNSGDSPEDQEDRGLNVAVGAVLLSGWLGLSGYGLTRLVLRMRRGPTPKSPPPLYSGPYGSIIIPDE